MQTTRTPVAMKATRWVPLSIVLAGVLLSAALAVRQSAENTRMVTRAVHDHAQRVVHGLEERMALYRHGLQGARSAIVVVGVDAIDAADFRLYAQLRNIRLEFPGARGFGFIRRVAAPDLEAFLEHSRVRGNASLRYHALSANEGDRYVIEFIEPEASNPGARGLDIASEPERAEAARRAARTGEVAMTAPVTLMQAVEQPRRGVLILLPVYRDGVPFASTAEREAAVLGWAYAPLVAPEVLATIDVPEVDWWIDDVSTASISPVPLFESHDAARSAPALATVEVPVFGRRWRLAAAPSAGLVPRLNLVSTSTVFGVGSLVSVMAGWLAGSLLSIARRRAESQERHAELLALRHAHEQRERLAAVLECTDAGTWEWNVQTGVLRLNERWYGIVGFPPDTFGEASVATWKALVHPRDLARSEAALEAHFEGRTPFYECDVRMRHRDGHWVWVRSHGKVKSRTSEGRPEWVFGTHLDITRQQEEAERRAASEALLNEMGEMANIGGWSLDIASQTLRWTPQTARIHGVAPDVEPTVASSIAFYAPEAQDTIAEAVKGAIERGQAWDLELPLVRADGRRIWVRTAGRAVEEGGRRVRLVGAFQDVTQDFLQRQAILEAHERLDAATEAAQIGIWSYEPKNERTVWNRQAFLLHGEVPFSAAPDYAYWVSHLHPDDRARVEAGVADAMRGVAPYRQAYRVVWPDGSIHHLEAVARVFTDAAGETIRVIGINRDITAETLAREELRTANRRLALATESGGVGVWEWNLQTDALWWDPQMYHLYGVPPGDGTDGFDWWRASIPEADRLAAEAEMRAVLEDPARDFDAGFPVIWPDGSRHALRSRAKVTRNGEGIPVAMTGVNWDVTGQRALESALLVANAALEDRVAERTRELASARDSAEAANRAKSEFLANMSHELRTPLHGILGFAKLVRDEEGQLSPDEIARYAGRIVRNGDQLLALVDDLLDSAKIDYGNFRIAPERADLMDVVRSVVEEFASRSRQDVELQVHGPASCVLQVDPRRIGQVCRNLLANAIRLSPADSAVQLDVVLSGDQRTVRVAVSDRGPGIPETELEAIFDRFAQSSKTKTGAGGTGLGLTISRSIAELHGGTLTARNRDGGGAVFELALPCGTGSLLT